MPRVTTKTDRIYVLVIYCGVKEDEKREKSERLEITRSVGENKGTRPGRTLSNREMSAASPAIYKGSRTKL